MNVASELLLDLSSRYGVEGPTIVLGGEAILPNSMDGTVVFTPTDVRESFASSVPVIDNPALHSATNVVIPAPPDRDLLRHQLVVASQCVADSGLIFVCGPNAAGGKSAIKDATAIFGEPRWSGYREKHRMAIFQAGATHEPAWMHGAGIAPDTWAEFNVETPEGPLALQTRAGVFAGSKLDAGTRLLLDNLHVDAGARVLDVGCGVGVIGITAALRGERVTMTDANLLAVSAAAHNVRRLNLDANVVASDVYRQLADNDRFDLIVSNPPFHRGKQVDYTVANEIIGGATDRLNPGGSLILVANAFLAYDKQIRQVFTRVDTIAATPQYHVLRGELS